MERICFFLLLCGAWQSVTSRALIERPYSGVPQAVGAVYDRAGFVVHDGAEILAPIAAYGLQITDSGNNTGWMFVAPNVRLVRSGRRARLRSARRNMCQ